MKTEMIHVLPTSPYDSRPVSSRLVCTYDEQHSLRQSNIHPLEQFLHTTPEFHFAVTTERPSKTNPNTAKLISK